MNAASFHTYGTPRVYRRTPGQYHEALIAITASPTVADALAAVLNNHTGPLPAALTTTGEGA